MEGKSKKVCVCLRACVCDGGNGCKKCVRVSVCVCLYVYDAGKY
jgi:hypothetical protein